MDNARKKSKQELLDDLNAMREENSNLQKQLSRLVQQAENQKYADVIIDHSPAILFRRLAAKDLKRRKMVYVSPNIARFGYAADEFMTNRIMFRDIVHPDDTERTKKEIDDYVDRGKESYTQIYRVLTRDGEPRWIEDHTSVVIDPETGDKYHQGIVVDIHRRKIAEDNLRRSEEKYRRIVETTSEGFLFMKADFRIVNVNQSFCRMSGLRREDIVGKGLLDIVAEQHRPYLDASRRDLLGQPAYEFETDLAATGGLTVPVLIHGNALSDHAGRTVGHMAFITDMSEHKKALLLARNVQRSLLPQEMPTLPGLDLAGGNISCDEIGGDYFDFLWDRKTQRGAFQVVVGDIAGHGVDSALLMTTARAFLRMRASQPGTLADIVNSMNRHFTRDIFDTGKFMTLFYLSVDADRKRVEWVRAGHEPAWLYDPDANKFEELKGPGLALGIDAGYAYQATRRTGLKKGQMIILATDGIWEGRNGAGKMFGKQRFLDIIRQKAADSAAGIMQAVFRAQGKFTEDARPEDDLTLVIIKICD